ncbi:MAG: RNA methyltransferase [Magnetococcales bacterium]|nr:RNA methyltransferase [Magnetococcales bacterium]
MTGLENQWGEAEPVVILDRPAHAGNVGAVIRAMGNTGFSRLRLVAPRQFPHPDVEAYAVGCVAILERVELFADLSAAVADLNYLVATTNRFRGQRQILLTPRELGERLPGLLAVPGRRVGILFGTERTGLLTGDVDRANVICHIPTAGAQGSLNLAQAVLIVLYELMLGAGQGNGIGRAPMRESPLADAADLEHLYAHMEETLETIGFLKPNQKRHMMGSIRAMFQRAVLDRREVAILRGILHEMIAFRDRS